MKQEKDRNEKMIREKEEAMKAKALESVSNKARLLFHLKDRNREMNKMEAILKKHDKVFSLRSFFTYKDMLFHDSKLRQEEMDKLQGYVRKQQAKKPYQLKQEADSVRSCFKH